MQTRRFTLAVPDKRGQPRRGEVLLAKSWQPELAEEGPRGDSSFLIVMLSRPAPPSARISTPAVAVCSPSRRVDVPMAVREPPAAYVVAGRAAEPAFPVFSPDDMASYAEGRILSPASSRVDLRRIFPQQKGTPRFELLAQALLSASDATEGDPDSERLLATLASALVGPAAPSVEATDPETLLRQLRKLLRQCDEKLRPGKNEGSAALSRIIEDLQEVVDTGNTDDALAEARRLFVEPLAFAEAVFLCRSLVRDPEAAAELAEMRAYLAAAVVPDATGDFAVDRRVTLEQLSPAALFIEPHRFDGMRATFEYFRKRFAAAYREHHRRYWDGCGRLIQTIDESEPAARALGRLNGVRELGRPVGLNALAQYQDMRASLARCPLDEALPDSLKKAPSCPMCGITLADEPPRTAAADVSRRLERALRQQQQRLSSAAIRRILAQRKEARVEQFLQVVQASDLHGLANVLDDELVAFLKELLAEPQRSKASLLAEFLRANPEISEASLDTAVAEFRRLLAEELSAQRQLHPTREPRIILDAAAASRMRK